MLRVKKRILGWTLCGIAFCFGQQSFGQCHAHAQLTDPSKRLRR